MKRTIRVLLVLAGVFAIAAAVTVGLPWLLLALAVALLYPAVACVVAAVTAATGSRVAGVARLVRAARQRAGSAVNVAGNWLSGE